MTQHDDNKPATIDGLTRLLDVFGADRSRWPARERLKYSGFILDHAGARRLVAEAEALDTLLDSAPEPKPANLEAVAARIMAATGTADLRTRNITPLRPRAPAPHQDNDRLIGWPAAALLAASLVLGVFAGTTDFAQEPIQSIAALTAPAPDADDDASQAVFSGEDQEELL